VLGSSSISYVSQSTLNIGTNLITVNAQNPSIRFGGIAVIDSGSSPQVSGSYLFDSVQDRWIMIHQQTAGSALTSSIAIMGPETYNDLGNETTITLNRLVKGSSGASGEHIGNSNISDTGTVVSINSATQITGSLATNSTATFASTVDGTIFNSTSNAFRFSGNNAISLVSLNSQSVVKINAAGYWGTQLVGANDQGILINNIGQVGIGTTSPGVKLQVDDSKSNTTISAPFNSDIIRLNNTNATTNALHGILLTRTNGASLTSVGAIMSQVTTQTVGNVAADLLFYTTISDVIAEKMRLNASGNLTVGSTDAGNAGTINVSVGLAGTTAGGLQLWAATNQTHYVQFGDGTTGAQPYAGYLGYAHSTDSLLFGTGGGTKMTLDSTGDLGLGVTPSAWGSNSFAFQTQGGAVWSFSSAYMDVWQNSYFNGTNSIYQTTAAASFYRQTAGRHEWNIASSGTAGTTISWTQAMTLNASGNLSIGNTNDTYKLDVTGTSRFTGTLETTSGGTERHIRMLGYNSSYVSLRTNTGFNSNYNAFNVIVNSNSNDTGQGNTSIPSWEMVLGGNQPNEDSFYIGRSPAGSFSFTTLFKLASTGAATFSSSVTANGSFNGLQSGTQNLLIDWSSESQVTTLTNTNLFFGTNAQRRMTITGAGNVGIGIANPAGAHMLQINNPSQNYVRMNMTNTSTGTSNTDGLIFQQEVGNSIIKNQENGYFAFGVNGAETNLIIAQGGNVLVGTDSNLGSNLNVLSTIRVGVAFASQASITFGDSGTPYWNVGRPAGSGNFRIQSYATTAVEIQPTTGNVGIGTTSPQARLDVLSTLNIQATGNSDLPYINFSNNGRSFDWGRVGGLLQGDGDGALYFQTKLGGSLTEKMRITSGGVVYINATSNPTPGNAAPQFGVVGAAGTDAVNIKHDQDANNTINIWQIGTTSHNAIAFYKGNTQANRGLITVTTSGTTYNTVSDYRLKENVTPLENGLDRVLQLKPSKFNWIETGNESEGFIAHELQEYFPDAVTGEKDGVYSSTGNIKPQSVDYGRITPLLVKAIQELKAENDKLKEILQRNNIQ
jgi:hypothetical protein